MFPNFPNVENTLDILQCEGLISSHTLLDDNTKCTIKNNWLIRLKYDSTGAPIFYNLHIYTKKNFYNSITREKLQKLVNRNPGSLYILNTTFGLISHIEALRYLTFGQISFKIN
jgi:ribosomal protein S8